MRYVRISLVTPRADSVREVATIVDDLISFYSKQRGFVTGYKLLSVEPEHRQIGRVTVWESAEDADAAAQADHVLARRSELQPLVEESMERSYDALDPTESLLDLKVGR